MDISDTSAAPTEQMSPELTLIINALSLASERMLSTLRGELGVAPYRGSGVKVTCSTSASCLSAHAVSLYICIPDPQPERITTWAQSGILDGTRCAEGGAEAELVRGRELADKATDIICS